MDVVFEEQNLSSILEVSVIFFQDNEYNFLFSRFNQAKMRPSTATTGGTLLNKETSPRFWQLR